MYCGLDQPIIPMWWRECVLLYWCLMKWLSSRSQHWLHLRLYFINVILFRITKNVTGACKSFRLLFLVVWKVASFFINLVLITYNKETSTNSPPKDNTGLIVITSICLQRIIIKMSKNLFFSFFSQLGACIMIA